jgi:DnaJ-class molecular chaperone
MTTMCPVCKGAGFLLVVDEQWPDDSPQHQICAHCGGAGYIATELEEEDENRQ